MKKTNFSLLVLLLICANACNSVIDCEHMIQKEAIFLLDVSDPQLFKDINDDLGENFAVFMKKTGLGVISPCERFTLTIAPLSSSLELEAKSASIAIPRQWQSKNVEKNQSNPLPLIQLMKEKITEYKEMTEDDKLTSGTVIMDVVLKAINRSDPESENTLVIMSDMMENNQFIKMYKTIPTEDKIDEMIEKLIDPTTLEEFKGLQSEGLSVDVIIVLKASSNETFNSKRRELKVFWLAFFKALEIENVKFIDNLSNLN